VLDHVPRDLAEDGAFTLKTLTRQAMAQLELRRAIAEWAMCWWPAAESSSGRV
jgi:hypothetical protein